MEKKYCSYGHSIAVIHRHIAAFINSKLKSEGLTYGYAIFLINISRNSGCSQKDLCARLMIDKTTTAKNIKKLESMGYIWREKDKDDQRFYHLYVTEQGEKVCSRVQEVLMQTSEILKRDMTVEQQEEAESILKRMESNICKKVCGEQHA